MAFADENFEIKPLSGEIWANSEIEVTITFRPRHGRRVRLAPVFDVIGRDERLPLWLTGDGIGPKGVLSYDVLDIGDIFVSSRNRYELSITNKGDIPAQWKLTEPTTPFAPSSVHAQGRHAGGGREAGDGRRRSARTSSASSARRSTIELQGSDEQLSCQIKGHVIGPTFAFDVDVIDFGLVSYEFLHQKTIVLTNTSDIAMDFVLSVPQDGTFVKKEFELEPCGSLQPGESQEVLMELVSTTVKSYDYYLTVDVLGVGQALLSMPIVAECRCRTCRSRSRRSATTSASCGTPTRWTWCWSTPPTICRPSTRSCPRRTQTKVVAEFVAQPATGTIPRHEDGVACA